MEDHLGDQIYQDKDQFEELLHLDKYYLDKQVYLDKQYELLLDEFYCNMSYWEIYLWTSSLIKSISLGQVVLME